MKTSEQACPGRESNRAPTDYKSRDTATPICSTINHRLLLIKYAYGDIMTILHSLGLPNFQ
jgi:hypothetical protein